MSSPHLWPVSQQPAPASCNDDHSGLHSSDMMPNLSLSLTKINRQLRNQHFTVSYIFSFFIDFFLFSCLWACSVIFCVFIFILLYSPSLFFIVHLSVQFSLVCFLYSVLFFHCLVVVFCYFPVLPCLFVCVCVFVCLFVSVLFWHFVPTI